MVFQLTHRGLLKTGLRLDIFQPIHLPIGFYFNKVTLENLKCMETFFVIRFFFQLEDEAFELFKKGLV